MRWLKEWKQFERKGVYFKSRVACSCFMVGQLYPVLDFAYELKPWAEIFHKVFQSVKYDSWYGIFSELLLDKEDILQLKSIICYLIIKLYL